jgi:hypothetical protein
VACMSVVSVIIRARVGPFSGSCVAMLEPAEWPPPDVTITLWQRPHLRLPSSGDAQPHLCSLCEPPGLASPSSHIWHCHCFICTGHEGHAHTAVCGSGEHRGRGGLVLRGSTCHRLAVVYQSSSSLAGHWDCWSEGHRVAGKSEVPRLRPHWFLGCGVSGSWVS